MYSTASAARYAIPRPAESHAQGDMAFETNPSFANTPLEAILLRLCMSAKLGRSMKM
jgi:hypothetical protein